MNLSKRASILSTKKPIFPESDFVKEIISYLECQSFISLEWHNIVESIPSEIFETSGLEITDVDIAQQKHGKSLCLKINGNKYCYVAPKGFTGGLEELARKFKKMLTFSPGKALAWLKQNSLLVSGSTLTKSGMGADVAIVR